MPPREQLGPRCTGQASGTRWPVAWSHPPGTIWAMPWAKRNRRDGPLVSESAVELSRPVAFKFAPDLNQERSQRLFMCAGARRFAYNHHIGLVKENLSAPAAEKEAGKPKDQMTPSC